MSADQKLDKILDTLSEISIHQAEMRKDLQYHIKRTDLLESYVFDLRSDFETFQDEDFDQVREHVRLQKALVKIGLTFIGVATGVVGAVYSLLKLFP